jgi:hypothetical protein
MYSLDLFSTSQTKLPSRKLPQGRNERAIYDTCLNNAPCFAFCIEAKKWGVVQGCCNDWNCPRCGQQRAREEYGRIVSGCREISKKHQMYFLTITCKGEGLTSEQAEAGYLEWTNRLLTRLRAAQKRAGGQWYYACVTERQKRQHPHSHFITTYCPPDALLVKKGQPKYYTTLSAWFPAKHDTLQSEILERATAGSGMGSIYDISRIESIEGGSRYISKYLFKESIFTTKWPKGWRRVRYSQNFPKLPEKKGDAFILITQADWFRLGRAALIVKTKTDEIAKIVRSNLSRMDVIVQ